MKRLRECIELQRNASFFVRIGCTALLLLSLSTGVTAQDESSLLRVMSFNIHAGRGMDGKIDLERIAKTIVEAKPHLVALQEVDRQTNRSGGVDQLASLARLTKMEAAYGKALDYDGGAYGVAALSKLEILGSKTFRLPSDDQREQRVALEVRVKPMQMEPFLFVVTHFDHHRDDSDRRRQAKKLVELFQGGPSRSILAGDFNAVPDSAVMKTLFQHWRATDYPRFRPTSPVVKPRRKIDYILIERNQPWQVTEIQVLDDTRSSDHRAIVTELRRTTPNVVDRSADR